MVNKPAFVIIKIKPLISRQATNLAVHVSGVAARHDR